MDPLQQLNDQLRQRANAERVKERTEERRLTPDERSQRELETTIRRIVREEGAAMFAGLVITGQNGIMVSGGGKTWSIGAPAQVPAVLQGDAICNPDDGTITINIRG